MASEVSNLGCDPNKLQVENKNITYNDIAAKLLHDRLLLTALELHTELLESGKEVRQLKDFFSNPGNFETQTQEIVNRLSRSGSQVTLDSLDLTRYSEDGAGTDERVAVLEFELRKAKETIASLRNNLTVATESETSSPEKSRLGKVTVGCIKPHEQRALNFLINEYLLLQSYKLTSITFADENQNQDFDDWDDVGLNISKPPELLVLYREGLKQSGQIYCSISTQTEKDSDSLLRQLQEKLQHFETLNSELNYNNIKLQDEIKEVANRSVQNADDIEAEILEQSKVEKVNSVSSDSPDRFEFIDQNSSLFKKGDSIITLEDDASNNSLNASDWMNINIPQDATTEISSGIIDFNTSHSAFIKEVFAKCYVNAAWKINKDNFEDSLHQTVSSETFVHVVTLSLLKIIPNIILNRREEVIPLLINTVHLNPKPSERDKLLQLLFNLKKKPTEAERVLILKGLIGVAQYSGESMVENEILPQCWMQLTHKHVERRLLVAEACIALMPFISSPIRNSLCLSMLQQMLEDKEDEVRETVIRALSLLTSLCSDADKYYQCEQLCMNSMDDSSNSVVNLITQILFPILGRWALKEGELLFLNSSLMKKLFNKLNYFIKDSESPNKLNQSSDKILRIINVIETLLPFLLMSVAGQEDVISNIEKDMSIELRSDLKNLCTSLTNPEVFSIYEANCGMILYEFDKYICDNPSMTWVEIDWVVDVMLPDLFNILQHIDIGQQPLLQSFMNLFSHICMIFGKSFSMYKIRPLLQNKIQNLEQIISSFNQFSPSLNVIPVYLTVLSYCDDYEELTHILKKFLCALPLCGSPLDCLEITVRRLCEAGLQDIVVTCLWAGVVHQRPLVRAASATLFAGIIGVCDQELLKTKVTAALVTLANDNDMLVRTATVPSIGNLITDCSVKEIHDKAYLQLQTYLSDTSLKENHTLLRQLIVTLGNIVNSCSTTFRNEVIFPQLTALSAFMSQMKNQTRKVDMALALLEAFTNVVYSPLNKQSIHSAVLPGLRHLEAVILENQSLNTHWETVVSMIKECDNKGESQTHQLSADLNSRLSHNVNHGVEDMRQRVSKIFNKPTITKPTNLPNFQAMFKKK